MYRLLSIMLLLSSACPVSAIAADTAPIPVTTESLESRLFYPDFSAPATVLSINISQISAETQGRILSLPAVVGDPVEKDAPLAELDCRDNLITQKQARAGLETARARLRLAQRQIKRSRSLVKSKSISEELLNQRETDVDTAKADLSLQQAAHEQALLAVERCRVTAPFSGVVSARLVGEGAWVSPGQAIIELTDSQRLEVSAKVALNHLASLNQATSFQFKSSRSSHLLSLSRAVPIIDTAGRNQEIRLVFEDEKALPGSSGRLLWKSRQSYLDADIPMRRNGGIGVFIADKGTARFIPLADALEGQPAKVDLPPDTALIIEGRHGLKDGDPIEIHKR